MDIAVSNTNAVGIRERIGRFWYGGIAVVVAIALTIQIALIFTGGQDVNAFQDTVGESIPTRFVQLFSFFTIQSNLFVLGTSIALALNIFRDGKVWRILRLDALLGIIITGLVYETILAQLIHPTGWALTATIGFHYISPWATLIGWLLFGPRPRMTWMTTLLGFIWPVAWLVYTFVRGAITGWYPYPFLDVNLIGMWDSVRNCLFILAIGVLIAVVLKLLDRHMPSLVRDEDAGDSRT